MLRLGLLVAAVTFVLDQVSKWVILDHVMSPPRMIEVTPFFNLVMVWNRGVSFGLLSNESPWGPLLLSALSVAISIGLGVWLYRTGNRLLGVALGLVIGGAIGNVIDRLRFGAVADFLDFHVAGYHWPAFNVADSGIVIGVALILLDGFVNKPVKDA